MTGCELDEPRCAQHLAVEAIDQHRGGLVFAHELAAIDVSIAGAMLRRDLPLPPGLLRRGPRVRAGRAIVLTRHGERAIAWQPMTPIYPRDAERLVEQQRSEARAVEEEFSRHDLPAG